MYQIRVLLTFIIIIIADTTILTQELNDLYPCGTNMGRSPWLKKFQSDPASFAQRGNETLYVPVTVHIVGADNGSNYYREQNLVLAFCTLNKDFEASGIQFYMAGPIRYINNTGYANHNSILKGAEMMFAHNVSNTMNTYIVGNAGGFCGYNLPYAGIVISQNCARPNDHTWAHEAGHHFGIPHPFLGWEGGVSWDNSVAHNYTDPAPDFVLYNYTLFKDVFYTDTLIVDTAYVERMDGSNCHFAADGFCDTAPDYLHIRWQCSPDRRSLITQTDPDGVAFTSDASLIMSYSFDNCSAYFTEQQMAAMRAYLIDRRSNYLHSYDVPDAPSQDAVIYNKPQTGESVYFLNVVLEWDPVADADAYLIQIATSPNFGIILEDTIVYQNSATFASLRNNSTLYWRVKALNSLYYCSGFSGSSHFITNGISAISDEGSFPQLTLYPNPVSRNQSLYMHQHLYESASVIIKDLWGREVQRLYMTASDPFIPMNIAERGIYILETELHGRRSVFKIVVTD
jgi:hypothetical protein